MEKQLNIAIGSDHGGFQLKTYLINNLIKEGYNLIDCGTYSEASCNYPEFAFKVAKKVQLHQADYGIVICTTGEGVCICANKVKSIRCGLIYNKDTARLTREHNNANMMAFGAKYIDKDEALECAKIFLNTPFLEGRHQIRVDMISEFEQEK